MITDCPSNEARRDSSSKKESGTVLKASEAPESGNKMSQTLELRNMPGAGPQHEKIKQKQSFDSKQACAICLEPYQDGEIVGASRNPNCEHIFHLNCIVNWLIQRDECALCRAPFVAVEGDEESPC